MILATKSGWLIATKLIRETPKTWLVKPVDEKKPFRVSKKDTSRALFNDVDSALAWMEGDATQTGSAF